MVYRCPGAPQPSSTREPAELPPQQQHAEQLNGGSQKSYAMSKHASNVRLPNAVRADP